MCVYIYIGTYLGPEYVLHSDMEPCWILKKFKGIFLAGSYPSSASRAHGIMAGTS